MSLAFSGAAFQDDSLPGRGLYVPMQRGLQGRQGRSPGPDGHDALSMSLPHRPRHLQVGGRAESPVAWSALNYEAAPEDPIDQCIHDMIRQLNMSATRLLSVRRLSPGEYEIDRRRVSVGWRMDSGSPEAFVFPPGGIADGEGSEPLAMYLHRVADLVLARNSKRSFEAQEAVAPIARIIATASPARETSFYAGSFYTATGQPGMSPAAASGLVDPRLEAMRMARSVATPVVPSSQAGKAPHPLVRNNSSVCTGKTASFYAVKAPPAQPSKAPARRGQGSVCVPAAVTGINRVLSHQVKRPQPTPQVDHWRRGCSPYGTRTRAMTTPGALKPGPSFVAVHG